MKLAKKYSAAVQSSNLRDDDQHHQAEVLAAMGLASVENPLGPLLYRVKYANQAVSYYQLLEQWAEKTRKHAVKIGWPQHIQPHKIAALSLAYWLTDMCQVCTGRKSDQIDNTPCLSGVDCAACGGTGRRKLDCEDRERPYIEKSIDQLDILILRAGDAAVRKLAKEFDF